jgi:hypothetical protein
MNPPAPVTRILSVFVHLQILLKTVRNMEVLINFVKISSVPMNSKVTSTVKARALEKTARDSSRAQR